MEFAISDQARIIEDQVVRMLQEEIIPAERRYQEEARTAPDGQDPPVMQELRAKARERGLWNLYLPDEEWGAGLSNHDYSILCEHMGRSPIAPRVFNCQAPDTGNAEILAEFGTAAQKQRWLKPLLDGDIRSCFSMTEPEVSGADPTGLLTRAERDGDEWVINGHKWFTSGAVGRGVRHRHGGDQPEGRPPRAGFHDHRADGCAGVRPGALGVGDGSQRWRRAL
jgi:acyl-CoA dehydrogenase